MNSGIMCVPIILAFVVLSLLTGVAITIHLWTLHAPILCLHNILRSMCGIIDKIASSLRSKRDDWLPGRVWHRHWDRISACGRYVSSRAGRSQSSSWYDINCFLPVIRVAIFTSVAESIFFNGLNGPMSKLHKIAPTFASSVLLRTGVTDLTRNVPTSLLSIVRDSYNSVLVMCGMSPWHYRRYQ